jgi:hypothetical protein
VREPTSPAKKSADMLICRRFFFSPSMIWDLLSGYRMNRFKTLVKMAVAILASLDLMWRKRQAFCAFRFKSFSVD